MLRPNPNYLERNTFFRAKRRSDDNTYINSKAIELTSNLYSTRFYIYSLGISLIIYRVGVEI